MPQRNVATNFTFEQQRAEINLLAQDFWSQKTTVDGAASTYLKHDGSNAYTGGTLAVPNAFTINANSGAGTLTISGNLQVTGTTTTVNTATLDVTDKNITIAKGVANDAAADGAGVTIDSSPHITWNFIDAKDAWVSSIGVEASTTLAAGGLATLQGARFAGTQTPTTGVGVEITQPDANTGNIQTYDRTNSAYKQLNLKGSSVQLHTGTTNAIVGTFNSTGLTMESGKGITCPGNLDVDGSSTFGANGSITSGGNFTLSGNGLTVTGSATSVGEFKGATIPTIQITQTTDSTDLQLRANATGGLIRTASNKPLVLGANQAEALHITGTGQVNIGGDYGNTDSKVTIVDATKPIAEATLNLQSSATSGAADTGAVLRFYGHDGTTGRYHASIKGAKENGTSGNRAGYLAFNTRPDGGSMEEAVRITGTGNVGIGDNNPNTALVVTGGAGAGAFIYSAGATNGGVLDLRNTQTSNYTWRLAVGGGDNVYAQGRGFFIRDENSSATRFVIDENGNVGMGVTQPDCELHVKGAGTVARFEGTGGNAFIDLYDSDDSTRCFVGCDGGVFKIQTSGNSWSDKLTVSPAGDLTVAAGTISDVAGNVRTLPRNEKSVAYTAVTADKGKFISTNSNVTFDNSATWNTGDAITVYNWGSSAITIVDGTGFLMHYTDGTTASTGDRTLASRGTCTLLCVEGSNNTFVVSGAGLT